MRRCIQCWRDDRHDDDCAQIPTLLPGYPLPSHRWEKLNADEGS